MNSFEILKEVISSRRTIKPAAMNGKKIDDASVHQLLQLADWAPTHGLTEPWRFIVYSGSSLQQFCNDHAGMYQSITPAEKFNQAKYENMKHIADAASHMVLVYMKRAEHAKIPASEEFAAVAAATQNLLLAAHASGIAGMWSTAGVTHNIAMKEYLGLQHEDVVMGLIYLGYTDEPAREGRRNIPLSEKIVWKQ